MALVCLAEAPLGRRLQPVCDLGNCGQEKTLPHVIEREELIAVLEFQVYAQNMAGAVKPAPQYFEGQAKAFRLAEVEANPDGNA